MLYLLNSVFVWQFSITIKTYTEEVLVNDGIWSYFQVSFKVKLFLHQYRDMSGRNVNPKPHIHFIYKCIGIYIIFIFIYILYISRKEIKNIHFLLLFFTVSPNGFFKVNFQIIFYKIYIYIYI